jgi:hypothetical protein
MTTPPTINWANRISSDVYIRDCDDPTAQMRAQVFDVNYDKGEAEVGFYPERGVKFSMIHLPDIYRATIPLADLSLDPLSGAAEFGYADIIRRGDKDVDLSYLDWTGVTRVPVIATDDDGQPAAVAGKIDAVVSFDPARPPAPVWSHEAAEDALPEFVPSARDMIVPDPPVHRENPNTGIGFVGLGKPPLALTLDDVGGVKRAGGTAPLFTREEVHRKATQVIDWMKDELRKLEEMIKSME